MYSLADQSALRKGLNTFLQSRGIKARWLSNNLEIHETRISHFRNGRENLCDKDYSKLVDYLERQLILNPYQQPV